MSVFKLEPANSGSRDLAICLWGKEFFVGQEGLLVTPLPSFLGDEQRPRKAWKTTPIDVTALGDSAKVVTRNAEGICETRFLTGKELEKLAKAKAKDPAPKKVVEDLTAALVAAEVPAEEAKQRAERHGMMLMHAPGDHFQEARMKRQRAEEKAARSPKAAGDRQAQLIETLVANQATLTESMARLADSVADMKPERVQKS